MKAELDQALLRGRWQVTSWRQEYDDGRVTYPLGRELEGFLQYDADGRMACMIARADRARFATGGQWNAADTEKAAAYSSFLAYGGRYTVEGDVVTHHVELSLFPNWKGGEQRRRVSLQDTAQGPVLDIVARLEEGTPEARSAILSWRRAAT
jgi:hypothetical protein